jgi:hypothetical protein
MPKEPAKMPDIQWNGSLATIVNNKAAALAGQFYPVVEANLEDITD